MVARTHRLLSWLAFAAAWAPESSAVHVAWIRHINVVIDALRVMLDRDKASPEDFYRGIVLLKSYIMIANRHYRRCVVARARRDTGRRQHQHQQHERARLTAALARALAAWWDDAARPICRTCAIAPCLRRSCGMS